MPPPEQSADKLLVAVRGDLALVRVVGRGSFKISPALKDFCHGVMEKGCRRMAVDMADCVGMDSTFMGVLAGLAARLRQKGGGKIVMANLSLRTRGLLATLGLDEVIEPHMAGAIPAWLQPLLAAPADALDIRPPTPLETAETMLEAHQDLVKLSPENLPKFKDVLRFLSEDLKKTTGGGDTKSY